MNTIVQYTKKKKEHSGYSSFQFDFSF